MAPGSSVILIGTHQDQLVKLKNYRQLSENFQSILHRRFIDTSQSGEFGYPKVLDSIEVSSRTGSKIKDLCTLIYDISGQLLAPGKCKERHDRHGTDQSNSRWERSSDLPTENLSQVHSSGRSSGRVSQESEKLHSPYQGISVSGLSLSSAQPG